MKKLIAKILTLLGPILKDRWEYFSCGMVTGAFFAFVMGWGVIMPMVSAATLGLLKEIWGEVLYGEFSYTDWLAMALGGLLINAFAWVGMLL